MKFLSPSSGYTSLLIVGLILLGVMTGLNYFLQPFAPAPTPVTTQEAESSVSPSPSPVPWAGLNQRQKVAQLIIAPLKIEESTVSGQTTINQESWQWIQTNRPGGVILFGTDIRAETVASISASLTADKNYTPWLAVDHEGGEVQRLLGDGFTPLPSWRTLCDQTESDRQRVLADSAQELADVGINLVFGPVVDVASRSAVLKSRVCSGDPVEVSLAGRQAVSAYREAGILPVIKHFPGIGTITADLHQRFSRVNPSNSDGLPFHALLTEFPSLAVMTTFSGVTGVCDNQPCALSPACLSPLKSRYPKSLLITDALDMSAAGYSASGSGALSLPARSSQAITAGNHLLVYGPGVTSSDLDSVVDDLSKSYQNDQRLRSQIDHALTQVYGYRQLFLEQNKK